MCSVEKPLCSLWAFCLACVEEEEKKKGKAPENCQRNAAFGVDIWRCFKQILRTPYQCACVFTKLVDNADQEKATESSVTESGHPINRQKYALLAGHMIALLSHNSTSRTWTLANCSSYWPSRLTTLPVRVGVQQSLHICTRQRRIHVSIVDRR